LVCPKKLVIGLSFGFSIRNELLEILFELLVEQLNLFDKIVFHGLQVFDILVLDTLTFAFESGFHVGQLRFFLLSDSLNHVTEFLSLLGVLVVNLRLLSIKLIFDDVDISLELLIETT